MVKVPPKKYLEVKCVCKVHRMHCILDAASIDHGRLSATGERSLSAAGGRCATAKPTCLDDMIASSHLCRIRGLIVSSIRLNRSLTGQNQQSTYPRRIGNLGRAVKRDDGPDEADEFGKLAPEPSILHSEFLPDDTDGYDTLEKLKRKRGIKYYDKRFVDLRFGNQIDRAKKMYELWMQMKQEDRIVKPWYTHYALIIATMAQSGLTDKAFYFFKELLADKRNPSHSMITSLFNACANSYDRDEGLSYAHYLRDWIYETNFQPNLLNYNAMIKAFSRHGDLKMSFSILKEMTSFGHQPNDYTYNMLLQGAISDKKAGFSHAVRIVRETLKKLSLDEPTLRQFLTCTAKCGIGSLDHLTNLFEVSEIEKLKQSMNSVEKPISQLMLQVSNFNILTMSKIDNPMELLPLLNIESFDEAHNRLALVGGLNGIFNLIDDYNIKLTVPLFLELLRCLPPQIEAEQKLIEFIRSKKFNPAVEFFNFLIKRRAFRMADGFEIKQALQDLSSFRLQPDIVTFGALALTCRTVPQMKQFLSDMNEAGFKVNGPIMYALIDTCSFKRYFVYLEHLIKMCVRESIPLPPGTVQKILLSISRADEVILKSERGLTDAEFRANLGREVENFKKFFEFYSKKILIDKPIHEREQFDFQVKNSQRSEYLQFKKQMKELILKNRN